METALIGLIISAVANCIYAARNFFDKKIQILLTATATAIWFLEYFFIFHSATYTLIMSFTFVYLIAYHYRIRILRIFKIDITFILMLLFVGIAIVISFIIYEGINSVYGIVILFLDLFAAYMFSAQGLRYKNGVVSLLYSILDFNIGNYFVVVFDLINFVVPIFTIIKHRKERVVDLEGLKEYYELVKFTHEIRLIKNGKKKWKYYSLSACLRKTKYDYCLVWRIQSVIPQSYFVLQHLFPWINRV